MEYSDGIERDWTLFIALYRRNQYVVENRWVGMTQEMRAKVLTYWWEKCLHPEPRGSQMPLEHRPDLR